MSEEDPDSPKLPKLLSVPGLMAVAIFGFFFRTGVQRLLRWAPGGETFEEFAERLRELLQGFDVRERESEGSQDEEKPQGLPAFRRC